MGTFFSCNLLCCPVLGSVMEKPSSLTNLSQTGDQVSSLSLLHPSFNHSHTLTHAHTHTTYPHTHTLTHTHTTHTHTHYTHTPEAGSPRIVTGVASQLSNLSLTSVTSTDTEHSTLSAQEETHAPKQQHKSCACCNNSCSFPGLQF